MMTKLRAHTLMKRNFVESFCSTGLTAFPCNRAFGFSRNDALQSNLETLAVGIWNLLVLQERKSRTGTFALRLAFSPVDRREWPLCSDKGMNLDAALRIARGFHHAAGRLEAINQQNIAQLPRGVDLGVDTISQAVGIVAGGPYSKRWL
jgi:hypothetical protein